MIFAIDDGPGWDRGEWLADGCDTTEQAIEAVKAEVLAVVEADSPLDALNAYAEGEGFAGGYVFETADTPADAMTVYTLENGLVGAPFTNFEIVAYPLETLTGNAGVGIRVAA